MQVPINPSTSNRRAPTPRHTQLKCHFATLPTLTDAVSDAEVAAAVAAALAGCESPSSDTDGKDRYEEWKQDKTRVGVGGTKSPPMYPLCASADKPMAELEGVGTRATDVLKEVCVSL